MKVFQAQEEETVQEEEETVQKEEGNQGFLLEEAVEVELLEEKVTVDNKRDQMEGAPEVELAVEEEGERIDSSKKITHR